MAALPQVLQRQRNGTQLRLQLWIGRELDAFDGHFPQHPVLPGVIQLAWPVHFASEEFGFEPAFGELVGVKFQRVIQPERRVELLVELDADAGELSFQYRDDDGAYSSGRLRTSSDV